MSWLCFCSLYFFFFFCICTEVAWTCFSFIRLQLMRQTPSFGNYTRTRTTENRGDSLILSTMRMLEPFSMIRTFTGLNMCVCFLFIFVWPQDTILILFLQNFYVDICTNPSLDPAYEQQRERSAWSHSCNSGARLCKLSAERLSFGCTWWRKARTVSEEVSDNKAMIKIIINLLMSSSLSNHLIL